MSGFNEDKHKSTEEMRGKTTIRANDRSYMRWKTLTRISFPMIASQPFSTPEQSKCVKIG